MQQKNAKKAHEVYFLENSKKFLIFAKNYNIFGEL